MRARARQLGEEFPKGASVSVDQQGYFVCTAQLDGQTLRVVGAINTRGDYYFATGSVLTNPARAAAAVEQEYQRQVGRTGTATCGSYSVIVSQLSPPIECEVRGPAGEVITARVTPDAAGRSSVTISNTP